MSKGECLPSAENHLSPPKRTNRNYVIWGWRKPPARPAHF